MYRNLFRFMKSKANLSWKMTGRLIMLAVYGEEHEADDDYPILKKELSIAHFARRKFFNILKPIELLFTAISMSLNKLMGVGDEKLSFAQGLGFGLKLLIIDFPLAVLKLISTPANSIIRVIKNGIQDSWFKKQRRNSLFPWASASANNISRFLFNSNKDADTFPHHKMNTRYVLLSLVGGDPACPPDDYAVIALTTIKNTAQFTQQVASQVEMVAGNVHKTTMAVSVSAAGAAQVLPPALSPAMYSISGSAAALGGAAIGIQKTASMTNIVAQQIESKSNGLIKNHL